MNKKSVKNIAKEIGKWYSQWDNSDFLENYDSDIIKIENHVEKMLSTRKGTYTLIDNLNSVYALDCKKAKFPINDFKSIINKLHTFKNEYYPEVNGEELAREWIDLLKDYSKIGSDPNHFEYYEKNESVTANDFDNKNPLTFFFISNHLDGLIEDIETIFGKRAAKMPQVERMLEFKNKIDSIEESLIDYAINDNFSSYEKMSKHLGMISSNRERVTPSNLCSMYLGSIISKINRGIDSYDNHFIEYNPINFDELTKSESGILIVDGFKMNVSKVNDEIKDKDAKLIIPKGFLKSSEAFVNYLYDDSLSLKINNQEIMKTKQSNVFNYLSRANNVFIGTKIKFINKSYPGLIKDIQIRFDGSLCKVELSNDYVNKNHGSIVANYDKNNHFVSGYETMKNGLIVAIPSIYVNKSKDKTNQIIKENLNHQINSKDKDLINEPLEIKKLMSKIEGLHIEADKKKLNLPKLAEFLSLEVETRELNSNDKIDLKKIAERMKETYSYSFKLLSQGMDNTKVAEKTAKYAYDLTIRDNREEMIKNHMNKIAESEAEIENETSNHEKGLSIKRG